MYPSLSLHGYKKATSTKIQIIIMIARRISYISTCIIIDLSMGLVRNNCILCSSHFCYKQFNSISHIYVMYWMINNQDSR